MTVQDNLTAAVGNARGSAAADRLCEACVSLFAVDAAAISLVFDGANTGTLGASGDAARAYDELQFTVGEGPCLETVARRSPVFVADLADPDDVRWPLYGPAMLAHDIRGVFAMPVLLAGEHFGALDFFCREPGKLDTAQLAGGLIAAELAQLPLLDLLALELQLPSGELDDAAWQELSTITRAEVSQATGVLMAQLAIEPAEALVRLRAYAFASGRTSSSVARDILDHRLRLDDD